MSDPVTITLDVRNGPSNGTDGFTDTSTSNGLTYCYKWSGGTDGAGGVDETVNAGQAIINVELRADPRYHIVTGGFGAGNTQFSFSKTDAYNAVITDIDNKAEDDYFNMQVTNSLIPNCTFWCDPRVRNKI